MKSMLSSPFVSSHRPNTELAAANTLQRVFKVVVIPGVLQCYMEGVTVLHGWCYSVTWLHGGVAVFMECVTVLHEGC